MNLVCVAVSRQSAAIFRRSGQRRSAETPLCVHPSGSGARNRPFGVPALAGRGRLKAELRTAAVQLALLGGATLSTLAEPGLAGASRAPMFANLPLSFEVNRGQADSTVQFLARGQACQFFVSPTEAILSLCKMDVSPAVPLPGGPGLGSSAQRLAEPPPTPPRRGARFVRCRFLRARFE